MPVKKSLLVITLFCLTHASLAALPDKNQFGVKITLPLVSQDPSDLHGYRASLFYQPTCLTGSRLALYFDAAFGHWWTKPTIYGGNSLSIYALSPVLRFYFNKNRYFSPFVDLSIGLSWLSQTHFSNRRFGMHFAFQDEVSIGGTFGSSQQFFVTASTLHYSNGSLAKTNAGITIPLLISLGYRF